MNEYSIDEASKAQGGLLPAVAKGQQDKALDDAVFSAKKGELEGPVKTQFGWYVFEVTKITPASQQSLDQSKDTIRNLLRSERQQKALDQFVKDFREDYRDETECADDYRIEECSNAPKEQDTGPASGGNPGAPAPSAAAAARSRAVVAGDLSAALLRLDEITRLLRRECPWDREQDERSIVPHTVEEAYELADAAHSGDDAKLLDELGDVLFQVYFLSLLLEERGRGSLADVAEHCRQKLIRRHPHVFGDRAAETAGDVVRNWDQIKRDEEGSGEVFGPIPDTLPSTLYAKKILRRARTPGTNGTAPGTTRASGCSPRCKAAVEAGADPELALRRAADRFRDEVEAA